jgi:hypothetical protein
VPAFAGCRQQNLGLIQIPNGLYNGLPFTSGIFMNGRFAAQYASDASREIEKSLDKLQEEGNLFSK